jgi:hypothetical protein
MIGDILSYRLEGKYGIEIHNRTVWECSVKNEKKNGTPSLNEPEGEEGASKLPTRERFE